MIIAFLLTTLATAQDKDLGKDLVDLITENDLALRDMGYFIPAKFSLIDLPVTLGHEAKPAPLVAIRAKTEGAEKNLREAGEKARKRGDTLTVAQKERCRWHLVATNVAAEKMNAQAAADL